MIENLFAQAAIAMVGLAIGVFAWDAGIVVFKVIVDWIVN